MAVVFVNNNSGSISKAGYEAINYAHKMGGDVVAVTYGSIEGDGGMGAYGASKVIVAESVTSADASQLAGVVAGVVQSTGDSVVVMSHDHTGKMVAPIVAMKLDAGLVSGAVDIPDTGNGFVVKKNVFSGKAMAHVSVTSANKVITVTPNSIGANEVGGSATVETYSGDAGSAGVKVIEFKPSSTDGSIPLGDADVVVSAGRGLKGPENWGMIEELAATLGAATACSRPVADIGWRPHHEHVGQTGVTVRPDLYIAIGISGAIQHLAGVNGSKVIVVINKDPEAPFFKAADYGIVGDAFEVVPKLIDAFK